MNRDGRAGNDPPMGVRARIVAVAIACGCGSSGAATDAGIWTPLPSSDEGSGSESGSGDAEAASGDDAPASDTGATDEGEGSSGDVPPFECDVTPLPSPVLDAEVLFDPAEPHPGDTLGVIVHARNGLGNGDAPDMDLEVQSGDGSRVLGTQMRAGGDALYYYAIADVTPGDVCIRGLIDGAPEVSAKITVTPRPPGPTIDGGIYKVVTNHQWTCDEQPDFGNEIHVSVRETDGTPIPGVEIAVRAADSTDPGSIYNADSASIPSSLVTDAEGRALMYDAWPISDHGLLVLELSVAGAASDIATEITTGWWEADDDGCRYCDAGLGPVNVWGHWSHTIELVRDPTATEVCRVETDHAGQAACGAPGHLLHDPDVRACWTP